MSDPKIPRASHQSSPSLEAGQLGGHVAKAPSKLDLLEALLLRDDGASIAQLMDATGWQQHSVRGAMAGALKTRGLAIRSDKSDGVRRYRAVRP